MRIATLMALSGLVALAMWTTPAAAQDASILVSTDWLSERLDDPEVVVLHVGNADSFSEGHVPGARLMELSVFAPEIDGMVTEMPDPSVLHDALESAGVSSDSRIVVYSASNPPQLAARLYLTLEHFGVGANTSLLDGGLLAWEAEGRPLDTETVAVTRGSLPALVAGAELVVDHEYVSARLSDGAAAVVDARDEGFWTGAQHLEIRAPRAGRVPGSLNVPFRTLVDDAGRILPPDQLEALFAEAGIERGAPVVAYCHVGQQASLVVVAAKLLGREVRLYDGSYQDWSQRMELPVATD